MGSPPPRSLPGQQFAGKNPPRPAAARAGRIFAGKLSAGGDFFLEGRNPIMGHRHHHRCLIVVIILLNVALIIKLGLVIVGDESWGETWT